MSIKKIFAGVMAVCVVAGAIPCGTYVSDTNALDFKIDGFVDEMTNPDMSASYTIKLYTNAGTVKLNAERLSSTSPSDSINNTLAITGVQSLPSGPVDLVIPYELDNMKISSIWNGAFMNVKGIRSIELAEGISQIGSGAFADCDDLETIKLPSTIVAMGTSMFAAIDNLKSITVTSGGINIVYNGALCGGSNIYCYPSKKTDLSSYTVPSGIKNIQPYCFFFNKSLETILLPESVEKIYPNAFVGTDNCIVIIMNKNCIFYDDGTSTNPEFVDSTTTICGYKGSTAEAYAKENNLKFIDIEAVTATTTSVAKTTAKTTTRTTVATTAKTTAKTIAKTTVKTTVKTTAKTTAPVTTAVTPTGKTVIGDANEDGNVNMADVTAIVQHIGNQDAYGLTEQGIANTELCDNTKGITGMDATAIQLLLANQINKLPYIE